MKKYIIAIVVIITFTIGVVFAYTEKSGRGFFAHNREQFINRVFDRVAAKLNMSDDQKTQAKAILEDSKTRLEPLMEKAKQNHEASKNLGTDGVFDEAKVQELSNQQAETMKQLFVEKEKTKAQLFAVLNADQREQAKKMMDEFGKGFQRGGHKDFGEKSEKGF